MSGEEPATQIAPVESSQMVYTVKLLILKKGEYTLWSMRMDVTPPKKCPRQALIGFKQKLISLLDVHGASVSNEDANQKFLRALPSSWNNIALIMRNKEGIDELDIDDLYNNLKVFEADIKGSFGSSSNSQNVAFLSTKDTNSSNEVNTANGSNSPQLDDKDLEQIDYDYLEEINLNSAVAMHFYGGFKRFYKKTERKLNLNSKEPVGFDKTKVECFNCHRRCHFARECRAPQNQGNMNGDARYRSRDNTRRTIPVETSDALVVQDNALIVQDGLGYDWSYVLGLESVEAQLIVHQKNEVVYEEKIAVLEFEVKDKKQFETSSKNLNKLINSQLSAKDKTGLRYGDQLNKNDSSGSEVVNSVIDSRSSNGDDNQTNDRFKKGDGYHAVPSPLTGNYMPPLADLSFAGLNDYIYRPTANKTSASISNGEASVTQTSNISVAMPKVDSVRSSEVLIEEWDSDDEDVFNQTYTKNEWVHQETNGDTGLKKKVDVGQTEKENVSTQQYIVFPLWSSISSSYTSSYEKGGDDTVDVAAGKKTVQQPVNENEHALRNVLDKMMDQEKEAIEQSDVVRYNEFEAHASRTFSPAGPSSGPSFVPFGGSFPIDVNDLPDDPLMPDLED
ncbi:ribonuclease H-like domain-containing protein [Tanacetum coccineum]